MERVRASFQVAQPREWAEGEESLEKREETRDEVFLKAFIARHQKTGVIVEPGAGGEAQGLHDAWGPIEDLGDHD